MELREKIAALLSGRLDGCDPEDCHRTLADAILAIPEIAEALFLRENVEPRFAQRILLGKPNA